ncbi:MAG: CinA family protein [Acidimicrobiales bacterium]
MHRWPPGRRLRRRAAASRWYRGGVVPYQEDLKRRLLGVAASSVYCEQAVAEMAVGAARLLDAHVAIATSGVAGEPVDGTAPGTVYIATVVDDVAGGRPWARTYRFDGEADEVCDAAVAAALRQVHEHLTGGGRRTLSRSGRPPPRCSAAVRRVS